MGGEEKGRFLFPRARHGYANAEARQTGGNHPPGGDAGTLLRREGDCPWSLFLPYALHQGVKGWGSALGVFLVAHCLYFLQEVADTGTLFQFVQFIVVYHIFYGF